ncbi:MAG: CHAT domain-containing protein [Gammaproteobacteria bacterium]|nr:CHAT domain-containing protein [Gammaproteobacteria bacterium]
MCDCWQRAGWITRFIGALLALMLPASLSTWAQASRPLVESEQTRLNEGQLVSVSSHLADSIEYRFETTENTIYLLQIDQRNVDVSVQLKSPGGASKDFNSPLRQVGTEFVLLDQSPAGLYRVLLTTGGLTEPHGGYTVLVSALESATTTNLRDIDAWRLMSDAAAANAIGTATAQKQALKTYEKAAEAWHKLGNQKNQAQALFSAAMLRYWVTGEWHAADRLAGEAANLYEKIQEPGLRADAILLQAMSLTEALNETEQKEMILDTISGYLEQSYMAHKMLGNTGQRARVRYFNALSNLNAGRFEQAKLYYTEAAQLFSEIGNWPGQRNILLDRAVIDIDTGDTWEAIKQLEELRRLVHDRNPDTNRTDSNFLATVLDQLGVAYGRLGHIDHALDSFSTARSLHEKSGDIHGEAESLRGIAAIYLDVGDLDLARRFLHQAQVAAKASNNGRVLGVVHATLGNLAYSEANYEAAKESHAQSLKWIPKDNPIRTHRQVSLAKAYIAAGDLNTALDLAIEARAEAARAESPRAEADALFQIGRAQFALGELPPSIDRFTEAMRTYARLELTGEEADAANAIALALAELARENPDSDLRLHLLGDAVKQSERAIFLVDGLLGKVSVPELRAHYAATRRGYYKTHIDLLMEHYQRSGKTNSKSVAEALATSERARARLTMDLLNEATVDLQESVDGIMAAEMNQLLDRLDSVHRQRETLLRRGGVNKRVEDQLSVLSDRMAGVRNQIDLLQVKLRRSNSRYRTLTAPGTVSLAEIQDLIDDSSVMLQYSLGEKRSFVWIVTNTSVRVVQLADRATIDAAAERLFSSLRTLGLNATARSEQTVALESIAHLVLQPVASMISNKRLIVVADGSLNYLPFQSLPLDSDGMVQPLMATREVIALPSMSVLAALRERKNSGRPVKTLAIFADPVFEASDPRLNGRAPREAFEGTTTNATLDPSFATRSSLGRSLPRLIGTRDEAIAITALVKADDPLVALGFEANRQKILQQNLNEYRYVHFATHGKIDRETPALSALVLSRVDEHGNAQDGYLRLHDIYRLDLNADLVVLSACETGLGRDIYGEGMIGLTQGFLYAGARSLLVSLWDVPDGPTSELMIRFYDQVLTHGVPPAAALRHAQMSISMDRRWRDPYFWSAFVLLGDWQ